MKEKFNLKTVSLIILAIWIVVQIVMIFIYIDYPQRSDQGAYMRMALKCYNNGEWYPTVKDVYSNCIWAPGFINWLILQLHIFGTLKLNMMMNLLMNIGICLEMYWLCLRFFSKRTGLIAIIGYCLISSNTWATLPAGTEIPFLFLSLSGLCLVIQHNWFAMFFAGILFFLANWVRPLIIVFMLTAMAYMFFNKYSWHRYVEMLAPFIVCIMIVGSLTKQKIGYFNYQSTTSGINLIQTSNDRAYGGVAILLLVDSTSTCYIKNSETKTFIQRDSIWRVRSIDWIKDNPGKFARLYILKLGGLFVEDSWADRPILGGDGFIAQAAVYDNKGKAAIIKRIIHMGINSLVYYIILLLFVITIWRQRKDIFTPKGYILLVFLLGVSVTCLFSVSPRYHYPFLFVCIIWAAYGVDLYIERRAKLVQL